MSAVMNFLLLNLSSSNNQSYFSGGDVYENCECSAFRTDSFFSPGENVGVVRSLESPLQLLQLVAAERSAVPAVFSTRTGLVFLA